MEKILGRTGSRGGVIQVRVLFMTETAPELAGRSLIRNVKAKSRPFWQGLGPGACAGGRHPGAEAQLLSPFRPTIAWESAPVLRPCLRLSEKHDDYDKLNSRGTIWDKRAENHTPGTSHDKKFLVILVFDMF